MKGEVMNLNRTVRIHGEQEAACYDSQANMCSKYKRDQFGGHTKAVFGFRYCKEIIKALGNG